MNKFAVIVLFAGFLLIFGEVHGQEKSRKGCSRNLVRKTSSVNLGAKIDYYARANRVDPRLFRSLIQIESANKMRAVSYKGAACLTQLMPATARRLGLVVDRRRKIDERFNIDKCLNAGARYLRMQLDWFGDVRLALAGYNAGEGAVWKYHKRVPPYRETTLYVEKISALYFGEKGHGISLAYNQKRAQLWVNGLYRRWRPRFQKKPAVARKALEREVKEGVKTETKRTRIKLAPKLRTKSITFW